MLSIKSKSHVSIISWEEIKNIYFNFMGNSVVTPVMIRQETVAMHSTDNVDKTD